MSKHVWHPQSVQRIMDRYYADGAGVAFERLAQLIATLETRERALEQACEAAYSALRSYQHGNSAPALAEQIADHLRATIDTPRSTDL